MTRARLDNAAGNPARTRAIPAATFRAYAQDHASRARSNLRRRMFEEKAKQIKKSA
jgi:hypothetical protein